MLDQIAPLTQTQRITARQHAQAAVIALAGQRPDRATFHNSQIGKYPGWLVGAVLALAFTLLIVAFIPSAIRLYHIGANTFGEAVPDNTAMMLVGVCVVLLAESSAILFTLSYAVLDLNRTSRAILLASIGASATLAIVGNYEVAIMGQDRITLFTWLEALLPPALTLATAYLLKEVALHSIANRHADNIAYDVILTAWKVATADPEQHPAYAQAYANALRDELIASNRRRKAGREALEALTAQDWPRVIYREIQADCWYVQPEPDSTPAPVRAMATAAAAMDTAPMLEVIETRSPLSVTPNGNGKNGHSPNGH